MEKIELTSRVVKPTLKELHAMGWTKNHLRLDVFCVGKWRNCGYFKGETALQRTLKEAQHKMAVNTGTTPEDRIVILPPDMNNIITE